MTQEGRSFTTFPEWMKMVLFTLFFMLAAVILFHASEQGVVYVENKPAPRSFYIINRAEYLGIDNKTVYVLEYSCDGVAQIMPSFPTLAERDKFEVYLMTIGTVEQYKGGR